MLTNLSNSKLHHNNRFGSQELGAANEFLSFCQVNYGVTFATLDERYLLLYLTEAELQAAL